MPPRNQHRGGGHHHHHHRGGGPGPRAGPGPRRAPIPGPFWFPFWRPVGPGERLCWLCFWMTPPSPPPPVYEEHHHYYDETSSQQQAPPPIIVEALLMNPSSTAAGYRELYAVDYKQGDNPEKFYVQIPLDATPGSFLECRLGSKQTRVLLPKDIGLGDTVIVVSRRNV